MLRRALTLACLLAAPLACAACGKHPGPHHVDVALVGSAPGSGYDVFVHEAAAGLAACRQRSHARIDFAQPVDAYDVESQLVLMATEAKSAVFAVGAPVEPVLDRVARRFDTTQFVLIDGLVPGPNIESIRFNVRDGSYLAGALAALVSKTHHVAFLGGLQSSVLAPYREGFTAGAKAIDPRIVVSARYTNSFSDSTLARTAARALHAQGVDVIYVAAGAASAGAPGNGAAVIASDTDENATPGVIASMVKDVARAAEDACLDLVSEKPVTGVQMLGVGNGVSLLLARGTHLEPAARARYDALVQQVSVAH